MKMPTNYNVQTTTNAALAPEMQTYYDKVLLMNMRPNLVHLEFGQMKNIPKNAGKTINFRKFTPFAPITTPLTEGVVPDGQDISVTEITATVAQYGGYVTISDLLDMAAIDPVLAETIEELGAQGGLSVDAVIQAELLGGTNVQYANNRTFRHGVLSTDLLTTTEIRKAVRTLKNNKAKPFKRNGRDYYVCIVSPNATYDLQSDQLWQDVSKYQEAEQIFTGEIGRLFGVVFVETTQVKQLVAEGLTAASSVLTAASYTATTKTLVVDEAISAAEATAIAKRKYVLLCDVSATGKPMHKVELASVGAAAAGSASLVLKDTAPFEIADGDIIYPAEGGYAGATLEQTLVLGQNAYGVISIDGGHNVKSIVKPAASSGPENPLNQYGTAAWKVEAFCAKILQDAFMVRIEHGISE